MSERPVRVAVIDSGVNAAHPHIGGVAGGVAITADGSTHHDYLDRLGHGTAVAAAIKERAPGADLLAVKVFHRDLTASIEALVAAIDWSSGQKADLINLSLGTANPDHAAVLRDAVERASRAGALLVGAGTSDGVDYLPGGLTGVVSVELDWTCPRLGVTVSAATGDAVVCRASGYARPMPGVSPERNLKGISFAVANTTGVLARELRPGSRASVTTAVEALRRVG
jgi:subtilisin family serine protease